MRRSVQYHQRILELDPIGYWIQDEKQGAVAYDRVTAHSTGARNGAYTGVSLGQPGIGDGRTAPLFDGANDFNNVFSASFAGAFSGVAGTLGCWIRVFDAGVWTDGAARHAINIRADDNNWIYIRRQPANGTLLWYYEAATVADSVSQAGYSFTGWDFAVITWDKNVGTGEMKAYLTGAQVGATQVNLGVWANLPANTSTCVGAANTTPALMWNGYVAHPFVLDYALSSDAVRYLYRAGISQ